MAETEKRARIEFVKAEASFTLSPASGILLIVPLLALLCGCVPPKAEEKKMQSAITRLEKITEIRLSALAIVLFKHGARTIATAELGAD